MTEDERSPDRAAPSAGGAGHGDPGTVAVLLNPTAGRGRHRDALPGVLDRLRSTGREVTVLAATTTDEALAACRSAVASGAGALVAAGVRYPPPRYPPHPGQPQ